MKPEYNARSFFGRRSPFVLMKVFLLPVSLCFFAAPSPLYAADLIREIYWAKLKPKETNEEIDFSLEGEVGFLLQAGNSASRSLNAKIRAEHNLSKWHNLYKGNVLYKQKKLSGEHITQVQRWFLSAQMEYKIQQVKQRLFFYSDIELDRFSGYRFESSMAVGFSSQLWKDDTSELTYSLGPGYALAPKMEASAPEKQGFIARGAMEYKLKISEQAYLRQFLSTEADTRYTKTRSETSLSAKLNNTVALKLALTLRHNDTPIPGRQKLDSQTSVNLVYTFF